YEDFLTHQEDTLRRVCTFLQIDYLPQMLDVSHSTEAKQISQLSALWTSNCFPPIVANIDKFKRQLSLSEIEVIETLTKDDMQRYGYERLTNAATAIDALAHQAARERSDAARQAAWLDLQQSNFRDYVLRKHRAHYLADLRARLTEDAAVRSE